MGQNRQKVLICFVNDAPSIENSSGPLCCLSWIGSHVCISSSSSDNDNQSECAIQHVQTMQSSILYLALHTEAKLIKSAQNIHFLQGCDLCYHRGTMMKMMIRKRKMVLTCSSIFHCTSCLTPPTLSKTFLHRISHISPIKDPVRYLSQPI